MFIDPDIPIPPNMPKMLQEDFRQLQEYYDADDWPNFDMYWEGVESSIKNFYGMGKLTYQEVVQLFHRYGVMI